MVICYAAIENKHREVKRLILDSPRSYGTGCLTQTYWLPSPCLWAPYPHLLSPSAAFKTAWDPNLRSKTWLSWVPPVTQTTGSSGAQIPQEIHFFSYAKAAWCSSNHMGPLRALFEKCQSSVALEGLPQHVGSHAHSLPSQCSWLCGRLVSYSVNWMAPGKLQHFAFNDLLFSGISIIPTRVLLIRTDNHLVLSSQNSLRISVYEK